MGGGSPEGFASVLCSRDASRPRSEKSLVLASVKGNVGISAVARQMHPLWGPSGSFDRQDMDAGAMDVDASTNEDGDFAALAARCMAKKKGENEGG